MKTPSAGNQNLQAGYKGVMLLSALVVLREEAVWGEVKFPTILGEE